MKGGSQKPPGSIGLRSSTQLLRFLQQTIRSISNKEHNAKKSKLKRIIFNRTTWEFSTATLFFRNRGYTDYPEQHLFFDYVAPQLTIVPERIISRQMDRSMSKSPQQSRNQRTKIHRPLTPEHVRQSSSAVRLTTGRNSSTNPDAATTLTAKNQDTQSTAKPTKRTLRLTGTLIVSFEHHPTQQVRPEDQHGYGGGGPFRSS